MFIISSSPIPYKKNGLIIVKDGNWILQNNETKNLLFPPENLSLTQEDEKNLIFIGTLNEQNIFALEKGGVYIEGADYIKDYLFLELISAEESKLVFRACQLLNWHNQSLFCGCCGGTTYLDGKEFVKICGNNSRHRFYPQYSPSMIVLVRNGENLLLARSPHFPQGLYATLAGFLEAGETAEEAVVREVMEEVGIEIKNIKPIKAGPWPFPNSLMLAYIAEAATTELKFDGKEIEDARWFHFSELDQVKLPLKASIAYDLIQIGIKDAMFDASFSQKKTSNSSKIANTLKQALDVYFTSDNGESHKENNQSLSENARLVKKMYRNAERYLLLKSSQSQTVTERQIDEYRAKL